VPTLAPAADESYAVSSVCVVAGLSTGSLGNNTQLHETNCLFFWINGMTVSAKLEGISRFDMSKLAFGA
jgi:hypothetical protein